MKTLKIAVQALTKIGALSSIKAELEQLMSRVIPAPTQYEKEKELTKLQGLVASKQKQLAKLVQHEQETRETHRLACNALEKVDSEVHELDAQLSKLFLEVAEARKEDVKEDEQAPTEGTPGNGAKDKAQWMKQNRKGRTTEDVTMNAGEPSGTLNTLAPEGTESKRPRVENSTGISATAAGQQMPGAAQA